MLIVLLFGAFVAGVCIGVNLVSASILEKSGGYQPIDLDKIVEQAERKFNAFVGRMMIL